MDIFQEHILKLQVLMTKCQYQHSMVRLLIFLETYESWFQPKKKDMQSYNRFFQKHQNQRFWEILSLLKCYLVWCLNESLSLLCEDSLILKAFKYSSILKFLLEWSRPVFKHPQEIQAPCTPKQCEHILLLKTRHKTLQCTLIGNYARFIAQVKATFSLHRFNQQVFFSKQFLFSLVCKSTFQQIHLRLILRYRLPLDPRVWFQA